MNILFVNSGDFTTNSLNHIAGFSAALSRLGHACAVAVPGRKETLSAVRDPQFIPVSYDDVLVGPSPFPDGRPADIVHAWTPREGVRRFVLAYQPRACARLVVHMEDNEQHLVESWTKCSIDDLRRKSDIELGDALQPCLPHPVRYRNLLWLADGITVIIDRLRDIVPPGVPVYLLTPGVDFALYQPQPADQQLRSELGLRPEEKVIVYTGSLSFANESEICDLYAAVRILNQRGIPTRLLRTGFSSPEFQKKFATTDKNIVIDLGFVEKSKLPALLALADVLVQPGHTGVFNDYRFPSKLPEFLAMGKPVILPATNIAMLMEDGRDALILRTGTPDEIADACVRIFTDPALAERLGRAALAFARRHFDLELNTAGLAAFYASVAGAPARTNWSESTAAPTSDVPLLARQLYEEIVQLRDSPGPADLAALERLASQADDLSLLCRQLEADARKTPFGRWEEILGGNQLGKTRAKLAEAEVQLRTLVAKNVEHELRLQHLSAQLSQREGRIQRMQQSFSWHSTAPLRWLRRRFLDRTAQSSRPTPPPKL